MLGVHVPAQNSSNRQGQICHGVTQPWFEAIDPDSYGLAGEDGRRVWDGLSCSTDSFCPNYFRYLESPVPRRCGAKLAMNWTRAKRCQSWRRVRRADKSKDGDEEVKSDGAVCSCLSSEHLYLLFLICTLLSTLVASLELKRKGCNLTLCFRLSVVSIVDNDSFLCEAMRGTNGVLQLGTYAYAILRL